jgi:hypothetical protein
VTPKKIISKKGDIKKNQDSVKPNNKKSNNTSKDFINRIVETDKPIIKKSKKEKNIKSKNKNKAKSIKRVFIDSENRLFPQKTQIVNLTTKGKSSIT